MSSSPLSRVGSLTRAGDALRGLGVHACATLVMSPWRRPPRLASRSRAPALGGGNGAAGVRVELADLAPHALARLRQLVLELRELADALADELELAVDVAERLLEQLAAALWVDVVAAQLGAHLGARLLGGEQRS